MLKPSQPSEKVKASVSLPVPPLAVGPTEPYWFYEYQWDGPKRHHVPVWEPRRTTFSVVFDGEARHLFSTARILLYYTNARKDKVQPNAWDIQQVGSMTHTSKDGISDAPPNDSSLPMLTIAFEVVMGGKCSNSPFATVLLRSPAACTQDLHQDDSTHILLEGKHSLTAHTLSLSVSFTHSTMLHTVLAPGCRDYSCTIHRISEIEYITTRIVRVLPQSSVRPRVTNACLPTELLLKIFGDNELCSDRHDDLLSFAQVCRAWSCSMEVLHSRLSFSDDSTHGDSKPPSKHLLDTLALARALSEKPILGRGFRHLTTNILRNPEDSEEGLDPLSSKTFSLFTSALIPVLCATKNLQHLHIAQLDASQAEALLAAFHDLRDMQTFSLGELQGGLSRRTHKRRGSVRAATTLNVCQLSRCMAKWPALKSMKVHHLHPSTLGLRRYTLRAPGCALTQLTIGRSHVSDKDLMHLFGASAKTLERVAFDRVDGLTNAGLLAFLLAVSRNLTSLTLLEVALPPVRQWGNLVIGRAERALDVVVDKMPRLRQLVISGDVASEFMLDRRSRMYLNNLEMGTTQIAVVQLWLEDVPRLCGFEADWKWPGWHTPERPPRR